jgi:Family of unknown function (DUF5683)
MNRKKFFLFLIFNLSLLLLQAQQGDTVIKNNNTLRQVNATIVAGKTPMVTDSLGNKKKVYSPRQAAIRSAILPGLGQAYNKKYWKIPIVYAAIGITGYVLVDNINTYNDINYALKVLSNKDVANYPNVIPGLQPLLNRTDGETVLANNRSLFRRNIDYSVLFLILFWGLNVVDATVDAHLKGFDVSSDLSMHLKPAVIPGGAGISLVFDIHKGKSKTIALPQ